MQLSTWGTDSKIQSGSYFYIIRLDGYITAIESPQAQSIFPTATSGDSCSSGGGRSVRGGGRN